jgi:hypothetical protein
MPSLQQQMEQYQNTLNQKQDWSNYDIGGRSGFGPTSAEMENNNAIAEGNYNLRQDQSMAAGKMQDIKDDPWGASGGRFAATDQLNAQAQNDPSNMFRDKLMQMVQGHFAPDDSSYQWRFQQGQQATERSLAAKGLLNSGNAAIELQNYGQGAASTEYGAQFQRLLQGMSGTEAQYGSQMNRLMQLAGVSDPIALGKLGVDRQEGNVKALDSSYAHSAAQAKDRGIGDGIARMQAQFMGG